MCQALYANNTAVNKTKFFSLKGLTQISFINKLIDNYSL